jgi:hypothetical protein
MSFDEAVRALAKRNGETQADHHPVKVKMTGEWSGYSEYTITNQWNSFTVKCGDFEKVYESEEEARIEGDTDGWSKSTKSALVQLWDDLESV